MSEDGSADDSWFPGKSVTRVRRILTPRMVAYEFRVMKWPGQHWSEVVAYEMDATVHRLSAYIWTESIQNETALLTVSVPRDWWQHVKQRFPPWALRRWPVAMRDVTETHKFQCVARLPEFTYDPPRGCGSTYVIETFGEKDAG